MIPFGTELVVLVDEVEDAGDDVVVGGAPKFSSTQYALPVVKVQDVDLREGFCAAS